MFLWESIQDWIHNNFIKFSLIATITGIVVAIFLVKAFIHINHLERDECLRNNDYKWNYGECIKKKKNGVTNLDEELSRHQAANVRSKIL